VKRYSFCPVCGSPYPARAPGTAAPGRLFCASCGFEFWQNSKPAVGAFIIKVVDGRPEILLSRRGIEPYKGMWDCPGGFLDNGELPEAGLAREMKEELGISIEKPRLFSLGIDEYPRDDVAEEARFVLSLYYRCELPPNAQPSAADDVAEARWFSLSNPPANMAFASNRRALHELQKAWNAETAGRTSG
jgi:ADP-ribose pyrophosphatase YjhB (NUDIX family)